MTRPFIRRAGLIAGLFLGTLVAVHAQETAPQFFDRVSERYGEVVDYSATLTITKEENVQSALVQYKTPNLLRLDFTEPEEMVLAVDGELLQIYVPLYRVTFAQPLKKHSDATLASMVNAKGLDLMKRNYTIAYLDDPGPVLLEAGSSERVVKLKLNWKSSNEGFREMDLSIDDDLMIRRIEGVTTNNETIVFDFTDYVLNEGIPDSRFVYDSPPEGNTIENFLFEPEGQP